MRGFAAAMRDRAAARLWRFALAATVVVVSPASIRAQTLEYKLKAEFLERFTRFIEWPASAFAAGDSPFVLCVLGGNPFGGYLTQMAQTRKVQNRKITNRSLQSATEIDGCHLVFVARSGPIQQVVARTTGKPVLTVGETQGFTEAGGLINFFLEKDQVRFEINTEGAKKSGLKFSSKLLELGRRAPPPGG